MTQPRMLGTIMAACAVLGLAGAAEPACSLTVTPGQWTVGDVVTAQVTYRWPLDRQLAAPADPAPDLQGVPVERVEQLSDHRVGGERIVTWELRLVVPQSGSWALPRPALRLRGSEMLAGGIAELVELRAPEVILQIGQGAEEPALEPPAGLWSRPTIDLPPESRSWRWWLAGGLVLVLALTAVLFLRTRKKAPPPPPAEVFARELAAARACGEGRQAGALLSLALRRYCGNQQGFDGPGATADEVLVRLHGALPTEATLSLRRILRELESLRWSPAALPPEALQPRLAAAEEWVRGEEERRAQAAAEKQGQTPVEAGR